MGRMHTLWHNPFAVIIIIAVIGILLGPSIYDDQREQKYKCRRKGD